MTLGVISVSRNSSGGTKRRRLGDGLRTGTHPDDADDARCRWGFCLGAGFFVVLLQLLSLVYRAGCYHVRRIFAPVKMSSARLPEHTDDVPGAFGSTP